MTESEKIKYRNTSREVHLQHCDKDICSVPLGHSPMEEKNCYPNTERDKTEEVEKDSRCQKCQDRDCFKQGGLCWNYTAKECSECGGDFNKTCGCDCHDK
jgi:hypothetical protein